MSEREEHPTVALDPRTITGPNWPVIIATLEQVALFGPFALRRGILALVHDIARDMAEKEAPASLVNDLQALVDALRHMPWEKK